MERSRGCTQLLKNLDQFGHSVQLTHKNSNSFKTIPGGLMTILGFMLILGYFMQQVVLVFTNENTLKFEQKSRNLNLAGQVYQLHKDNFDFAMRLSYMPGTPEIQNNIDQYLVLKAQIADLQWYDDGTEEGAQNLTYTELELVPCPPNRFRNNTEFLESRNIEGKYTCTKQTDFELFGQLSQDSTQYLYITVWPCNAYTAPGKTCKSAEEIAAVVSYTEFYMPVMQSYFDQDEYSEDVIKQETNEVYMRLNPSIAHFNVLKVSFNEAVLEDSKWFSALDSKNYTYVQTNSWGTFGATPNLINGYVNHLILLDEKFTKITRTNLNVWDALSNTGGIMSFVMITLSFVVASYTQKAYYADIMKEVFLFEKQCFEEGFKDKFTRRQLRKQGLNTSQQIVPQQVLEKKFSQQESFEGSSPTAQISQFLSNKQLYKRKPREQSNRESSQLSGFKIDERQESWDAPSNSRVQLILNSLGQQQLENLSKKVALELKRRVQFIYKQRDILKRLCCGLFQKPRRKDKLFQVGAQKLEKEFEVTKIMKKIRQVSLLSQIFLTKHQLKLTPYFPKNVLSERPKNLKKRPKLTSELPIQELELSIMHVIENVKNSKVDKRILKNLALIKDQNSNMSFEDLIYKGVEPQVKTQNLPAEDINSSIFASPISKKQDKAVKFMLHPSGQIKDMENWDYQQFQFK